MRRKVLQDFANVFCQQFVQMGSSRDVSTYVRLGSGKYAVNILTGGCTRDGVQIPDLKVCSEYRTWLAEQLATHHVPAGILHAGLTVEVVVANVTVKNSYGHLFGAADFSFECRSEIRTDEKVYVSEMSGSRSSGLRPASWGRAGMRRSKHGVGCGRTRG